MGTASTECIVPPGGWNGLLPMVIIGDAVSSWEASATEAEKAPWQDDKPLKSLFLRIQEALGRLSVTDERH